MKCLERELPAPDLIIDPTENSGVHYTLEWQLVQYSMPTMHTLLDFSICWCVCLLWVLREHTSDTNTAWSV